jgi:ParB family chromosome partitioning protein
MSLKDKLRAKTAGIGGEVDAELSKNAGQGKPAHPRTAIGQASAFQVRLQANEARIAELEAQLANAPWTAIPVGRIDPNPWQPRRVFKEAEILELAASIAEVGLIQPIVVRRKSVSTTDTQSSADGDTESVSSTDTVDRFELVAGEQRLRATKLLAHGEIKAIVAEVTDEVMAIMALAENLRRTDLSDYEAFRGIQRAEAEFPNRKRLAEAIGVARTDLYAYLSFANLPAPILQDLDSNPGLLGRNAAQELAKILKNSGSRALELLLVLWPRVVKKELDQTKLPGALEAAILRGESAPSDRDIRKLFVGKEQAGSITRDPKALTIKIRSAALTSAKETELRAFVEKLLLPG